MTRGIGTAKFMAPEIADGDYSATIDIWAFGMVMLICTGVTVPKPLNTQKEVDALVEKIPDTLYSDGLIQCIRAALTVKGGGGVRPSALDLLQGVYPRDPLQMPFFAKYYGALPEAMFQDAIKLANRGPWAALASVPGLKFDATANSMVQISLCQKKDGAWNSTEAEAAVEKHRLMVSNIPGNKGFAENYDVQVLAIAKSQLRAVQLVNKLQVMSMFDSYFGHLLISLCRFLRFSTRT
jgi:serine/threonine protein kinase